MWRCLSAKHFFATSLVLTPVLTTARYGQPPCGMDEVQGEVLGGSGYLCAPRCDQNYNCPTDVPLGTGAQPQCMLKDVDQSAFCALLCQVDSQCPSGARCQQLTQMQVGICEFPISFGDWAKSSVIRKFAVGWPKRAAGPAPFQIAKTYASLQTLKSKYNIDDGDADMVTLKQVLSALSSSSGLSTTAPPTAGSLVNTIWGSAVAPPAVTAAPMALPGSLAAPGVASQQGRSGSSGAEGDFAAGKFMHDAQYFSNNVLFGGASGLQKEVHDTVWNIEHIDKRGVASELLRGVLMLGAAYLCIGALVKSQTTGARGMDLIPHIGFWMEYPALVADGFQYCQLLFGAAAGKPIPRHDDLSGGLAGDSTLFGRGGAGARGGVGSFDAL
eukprot:TRINITY_DN83450_c0_g1_i1.p1 TRINITY_DN83450_c0_g1~~TRINITY_DN83450_c0_g1_i1.p1  ORF type:complete len:385 (+),score=57.47 TRINITY_DN83450_c0_g1_i1:64-1218(+)